MKTRTKIVTKQKLLDFIDDRIYELERATNNIDNAYLLGKLVAYREVYKFMKLIEE